MPPKASPDCVNVKLHQHCQATSMRHNDHNWTRQAGYKAAQKDQPSKRSKPHQSIRGTPSICILDVCLHFLQKVGRYLCDSQAEEVFNLRCQDQYGDPRRETCNHRVRNDFITAPSRTVPIKIIMTPAISVAVTNPA